MKNTGKEYEIFVENLYQALLNSEPYLKQHNIKIERNKKIIGNGGNKREFDIYWEYELAGITYKTVIECKDYNSSVSIALVDGLVGKLNDFPDIKGIFATKKGYQSGAKIKAEKNKIELLIVREQNSEDWQGKIKEIDLDLKFQLPIYLKTFTPYIDKAWEKENNTSYISNPQAEKERNDKIIIEDIDRNEKYSMLDLTNKWTSEANAGEYEKIEEFSNAFIYLNDKKHKLNAYKITYSVGEPLVIKKKIDFSKELLGVIEYLSKKEKSYVFKNNLIKKERP